VRWTTSFRRDSCVIVRFTHAVHVRLARLALAGALTTGLVAGVLIGATPIAADEAVPTANDTPVVAVATPAKVKKTPLANVGLPAERLSELVYAVGLGKGADVVGRMDSLYRGRWFMPTKEKIRACIVDRESNNNYKAVSSGGRWRGAYQMNRGLALGSLHQMRPEVRKEMGAAGVELLDALRKKPTQTWNRYWQDRAFWTVWRGGSGKSHWTGGAWGCFPHKSKAAKAKEAKAEKAAQAEKVKDAKAKKAKKDKAKKGKQSKKDTAKKGKQSKKDKAKKSKAKKVKQSKAKKAKGRA
jgi:hypothetical protein